jgi:hypothetical protein
MLFALSNHIQYIFRLLCKISTQQHSYSLIHNLTVEYSLSDVDINYMICKWLTHPEFKCDSKSIELFHRHIQPNSELRFTQDKLYEIGIKENTPETWKRVFELASEKDEWKSLSSPIVLFSKGLKAVVVDHWTNIFNSGFDYDKLQSASFESHVAAWEILIETEVYSRDDIFDLWIYTGCDKKLMIKIFQLRKYTDCELIKFGSLSDYWEEIFKYGHLTRDLDKILELDVDLSFNVDSMIQTGHINDVEKLLFYGHNRDCFETWNAIIASGHLTDLEIIYGLVLVYPKIIRMVIKKNLVSDISVLLNWALKNRDVFIIVAEHIEILSKLDLLEFPLPIKVEAI